MKHIILPAILFVCFLLPMASVAQNTGTISGQIKDVRTKETLIGVNVIVDGLTLGAATDLEGNFTLKDVPVGAQTLVFRYIGYQTFHLPDLIVRSGRNLVVDAELREAIIKGEEVTISAAFFQRYEQNPVSHVEFNPEEIRRSPGSSQELTRVLSTVPGVSTQGDMSQDLLVRGGSPSEVGFIIDNIPMPGVNHFPLPGGGSSGPIGIVNTELISGLDFYTGGFSAAHGDRMSAAADIRYREGMRTGLNGEISANMSGFGVGAEGGFASGHGSWLINGRRSYLDLIMGAIDAGGSPAYGDVQAKVVYDLSPRHQLTFLNIYGNSSIDMGRKEALEHDQDMYSKGTWEQYTSGLNLRTSWNGGYNQTSISFSNKTDDTRIVKIEDETPEFVSNLNNHYLNLRSINYLVLDQRQRIEFGMDGSIETGDYSYFQRGGNNLYGNEVPDFRRNTDLNGLKAGLFATYSLRMTNRFTTTPGLRMDYSGYNGQVMFSPRLAVSYQVNEKVEFTGSGGVYRQTLPRYMLSRSEQIRKLSNPYSIHIIGGAGYTLMPDLKFTVEVYTKNYQQMPGLPRQSEYSNPGFLIDNAQSYYTELSDDVKARATGIDLLLQKKMARGFYGTLSGSWFTSRYEDSSGKWRSRDYDNRWIFNILGGFRPNRNWEFSARWSYIGSRPVTPIDLVESEQHKTTIWDISRFNEDNLAPYHSLFLRTDRRFYLSNSSFTAYLEVWNAYNRSNEYIKYWNTTNQEVEAISQFSFLPILGIKYEF
ncbi:MAG: TonB-dependent receptor [Balneolales bacterium]